MVGLVDEPTGMRRRTRRDPIIDILLPQLRSAGLARVCEG